MGLQFQLLTLLCIIAISADAQEAQVLSLKLGDTAPPIRVHEWIKGTPVQRFEKGNVYVLEFWATWCRPCIAAMPHFSALANEYKGRASFLGIDVHEKKTTSSEKVKAFVDSMGYRMDYSVAREDSNFMGTGWLDASGTRDEGIPRSFVVDAEGRLAWIGHPKELKEVLPKIVNNTWDIKEAAAKRNLEKHLAALDDDAYYELMGYARDPKRKGSWKPDSTLLVIDEIVRREPRLKYAPHIAFNTFSSLLQTDPHKAYEYGKVAIVTRTYDEPPAFAIIDAIKLYSDKLILPAEIYHLGAEACQAEIDQIPYPEIVDMAGFITKWQSGIGAQKINRKQLTPNKTPLKR